MKISDLSARLRERREEAAAALSTVLVVFFQFMWWGRPPANPLLYWLLAALSVAGLFYMLFCIVRLWRKYRRGIAGRLRSLYARIARNIVALLERLNLRMGRGRLSGGRTTVILDLPAVGVIPPVVRRRRWRQLEDDRERLGYLYAGMVTRKVRSGKAIYPHQTPLEISLSHTDIEAEGELFSIYNSHRYYESSTESIDGERLRIIKEALGIK